jgi:hypothetical protein
MQPGWIILHPGNTRAGEIMTDTIQITSEVTFVVARTQRTMKDVLQRWPRLVSHMICYSSGYWTPKSAAGSVSQYLQGRGDWCEQNWSYAQGRASRLGHKVSNEEFDQILLDVTREIIGEAFRRRHHHHGYMCDYGQARQIVEHVRTGGEEPVFASWF